MKKKKKVASSGFTSFSLIKKCPQKKTLKKGSDKDNLEKPKDVSEIDFR